MSPHVIAVDWSGALAGERRKIAFAAAVGGRLLSLEDGLTRDDVTARLIEEAQRDPKLVVGLDFAFSMPGWYMHARGYRSAGDLWLAMRDGEAESILRECPPPFFGRKGTRRPEDGRMYRRCEERLAGVRGVRPKSVFQIGGAGAVGTGSLRGMPALQRLHEAGFSIWPFEAPSLPVVVEIYPRLLTGPVNKSDRSERQRHLSQRFPTIGRALHERAASTEDAFDAAISAIVMSRRSDPLAHLPCAGDAVTAIEGAIWIPVEQAA